MGVSQSKGSNISANPLFPFSLTCPGRTRLLLKGLGGSRPFGGGSLCFVADRNATHRFRVSASLSRASRSGLGNCGWGNQEAKCRWVKVDGEVKMSPWFSPPFFFPRVVLSSFTLRRDTEGKKEAEVGKWLQSLRGVPWDEREPNTAEKLKGNRGA